MATYYAGAGGNNGNAGTSWVERKLTIQAAVSLATTAGDIVYVGPGTYRETVTLAASGSVGNPIYLIGDYTGASTDGVGGLVRITGNTNETTTLGARTTCITTSSRRDYWTIRGFHMDGANRLIFGQNAEIGWTIEKCYLDNTFGLIAIEASGGAMSGWTIQDCEFHGRGATITISHSSTVNDSGIVIQRCKFTGGSAAVQVVRVGGVTVKNCVFVSSNGASVRVLTALAVGQLCTVNNCIFRYCVVGLQATTTAEFSEDYNTLENCVTNRTNVTAGANSVAYPMGQDSRPFFEAVNGGTLVYPAVSLASYSGLVEYSAGTGAPSTDWRGHAVAGSLREWGAEEYVSTYGVEAGGGVTMWPLSNAFIQTIMGGEV